MGAFYFLLDRVFLQSLFYYELEMLEVKSILMFSGLILRYLYRKAMLVLEPFLSRFSVFLEKQWSGCGLVMYFHFSFLLLDRLSLLQY